jgi:pimeloyl-ACP methyl ester carboxylesterase
MSQNPQPKHKILALHGWLDNCRSFHLLAPSLVTKFQGSVELVALDLPGHGRSSHKSLDGPPTVLTEGVYYIAEALDKLGWTKHKSEGDKTEDDVKDDDDGHRVSLIGHSMGGGLSLAYAGVFPENVDKLVLLDIYVSTAVPKKHDGWQSILIQLVDAFSPHHFTNILYTEPLTRRCA